MTNLYIGVAIVVVGVSLAAVHAIQNYAPAHSSTACLNGVCTTITMSKNDMRKACAALADSAFVQEMGGVKPDSPCGRL